MSRKMKRVFGTVFFVILLSGLLAIPGCKSGPKYNVEGKWETTINYGNGKTFTPQWIFKEDGSFYENLTVYENLLSMFAVLATLTLSELTEVPRNSLAIINFLYT